MSAFTALVKRDLRLATRAGGGALIGVLFFLVVVTLVPFALGLLFTLRWVEPGIVIVGAVLFAMFFNTSPMMPMAEADRPKCDPR